MQNWVDLNELNDLRHLYRNEKLHERVIRHKDGKRLARHMEMLQQDYIDTFGTGKQNNYIIQLKKQVAMCFAQYLSSEGKDLNARQMGKIYKARLDDYISKMVTVGVEEEVVLVENVLNRNLDLRKLTLYQFRQRAKSAEKIASKQYGQEANKR